MEKTLGRKLWEKYTGYTADVDTSWQTCNQEFYEKVASEFALEIDPNYLNKLAFKRGEKIEYKPKGWDWSPSQNPLWSENYQYRVKPAQKYVPFECADIKPHWEFKYKGVKKECEEIFYVSSKNESFVRFNGKSPPYITLMEHYLVDKQDGAGFVECHKLAE